MKIKTIPNIISFIRILLIPILIYLFIKERIIESLIVFLFAVISDKLDGFIARKYKQESEFGKRLDAIADTLMIFSIILLLYILNYFGILMLIFILMPRILNGVFMFYYHGKKFFTGIYAKIAAIFSYSLIFFYMLRTNMVLIYICLILTWVFSFLHLIYIKKKQCS